jgi:hypothetical protein
MNCLTEDMAIKQEEWSEIDKKIHAALHPHGWKKVFYWLREWGVLAVIITAFLALITIAVALGISAFNRVEDNAKFRQRTEDRLAAIEASLLALRAVRAAETPTNPRSQAEAKAVIVEAKKIGQLPEAVGQDTGKSFIDVAPTNPQAWNVALDFVQYRSSLNAPP